MSCQNAAELRPWPNSIGLTTWELRYRYGFDGCGYGVHNSPAGVEFDSAFHGVCGNWISYVHQYTPPDYYVDWVGHIGVTGCGANVSTTSLHRRGRAFDLSRIHFYNPYLNTSHDIDTNTDWKTNGCSPSLARRRQYLGVAVAARYYVSTVIIAWNHDTRHRNHIHFDNGVAYSAIRREWETDAQIVQAVCKYMNGETDLVIDGDWGPLTDGAYQRLISRLRMGGYNPRGNTSHARLFLHLIAQAALKGQAAGTYVAS